MKKLIWWLLSQIDNNHGYSTPLQNRFKVYDKVKVSIFKVNPDLLAGEYVWILETGRHDYLVENCIGKRSIVYQFELTPTND